MVYSSLIRRGGAAFGASLSRALFPGHCIFCARPSGRELDCCLDCEADLPRPEATCPACALPLKVEAASLCGRCQHRPPPQSETICALAYGFPVSNAIASFKYHRGFAAGEVLSALLAAAVTQQCSGAPPDALIAVPMHWRRRWARGFNQADFIAERLSRHLGIAQLERTLIRHRCTPAQQQLSAHERRRNLAGAFALRQPVAGLRLSLIDDVITTGSTVQTIGRLLLDHGAAEVKVWALARTAR